MALSASLMACPTNLRCFDFEPEVSRKDAKALRFLNSFPLFAPSRLGVSDRISCITSDWSAITAQPDCCREKCRRDHQPDPETRAAQVSSRSELRQRVDRGLAVAVKVESLRRESHQAVHQHGGKIRSAERNFLEDLDRDDWQQGPEKCRAPHPA